MKKLYTHENRMIIFNLKNVLQDIGIECTVINEFASGGAGDLSTFDTWPELWITDSDRFSEAESVLQKIVFDRNDDYWFFQFGVSKSVSDAELKKAYRRLMSQHHPDKLVAKGLPDEMIKDATVKTQQIKKAYENVKESRGL